MNSTYFYTSDFMVLLGSAFVSLAKGILLCCGFALCISSRLMDNSTNDKADVLPVAVVSSVSLLGFTMRSAVP